MNCAPKSSNIWERFGRRNLLDFQERMKHFWIVLLVALCADSLFAAEKPVELSDLNGKTHTPLILKDRKAVVLVVTSGATT